MRVYSLLSNIITNSMLLIFIDNRSCHLGVLHLHDYAVDVLYFEPRNEIEAVSGDDI